MDLAVRKCQWEASRCPQKQTALAPALLVKSANQERRRLPEKGREQSNRLQADAALEADGHLEEVSLQPAPIVCENGKRGRAASRRKSREVGNDKTDNVLAEGVQDLH